MIFVPDIFSRIGHMRGFGIQSPWAYSFVREVIAEKWPYYLYEEIEKQMSDAPKRMTKIVKLYFRIANRLQPEKLIDLTPTSPLVAPLIAMGCNKIGIQKPNEDISDGVTIVRLWLLQVQNDDIIRTAEKLKDGSMIFIEDINASEAKHRWKELCQNENLPVIFDLIDTAVIYIDRKMHHAVYKLNF